MKKNLKKVPAGKKGKGLKKLPRKFRNKMGYMKKCGRVGLKSGSKGCKLAMKGKGRAYGKNS